MVVFPSLCIRLSAPDDPVPQTEEHILLAPQVGVPSLIDGPEFITWGGGASIFYKLPGDEVPIIRGSALSSMDGHGYPPTPPAPRASHRCPNVAILRRERQLQIK